MSEYVPGLQGVPATESQISFLDGERGILAYRGYPIRELAEHSTFEECAYLLLNGELPTAEQLDTFDRRLRAARPVPEAVAQALRCMPADGHPMGMLQMAIACMGMFYPGSECLVGEGDCPDAHYVDNMSAKILASLPVLVALWERVRNGKNPVPPREDLNYAENFLYMLSGEEPDPLHAKILDVCLVLHAEHTINASTFSALVCGSALASPYQVIGAAVGTLSGPLHGGANERVIQMLEAIGSPDAVESWLDERLAQKGKVWGMGHREYKVKDPRAVYLQGLVEKVLQRDNGNTRKLFDVALALEAACEKRLGPKGIYPNVDFYSGLLYAEMGIPTDQFTPVFAVSRCAGWLAHWQEQMANNRIFRPTQIYTGSDIRTYRPLSERG